MNKLLIRDFIRRQLTRTWTFLCFLFVLSATLTIFLMPRHPNNHQERVAQHTTKPKTPPREMSVFKQTKSSSAHPNMTILKSSSSLVPCMLKSVKFSIIPRKSIWKWEFLFPSSKNRIITLPVPIKRFSTRKSSRRAVLWTKLTSKKRINLVHM